PPALPRLAELTDPRRLPHRGGEAGVAAAAATTGGGDEQRLRRREVGERLAGVRVGDDGARRDGEAEVHGVASVLVGARSRPAVGGPKTPSLAVVAERRQARVGDDE